MSSNAISDEEDEIEQIRIRFERDFLPKYGDLWRSMIEKQAAETAIHAASQQPSSPLPFKAKSLNFVDVIQSGRAASFQAPTKSKNANHLEDEGGECDCGDCVNPILEWEENEKPRETNSDLSPSSRSPPSSQRSNSDNSSKGSDDSYADVTTPLPADLELHFGRLSFGHSAKHTRASKLELRSVSSTHTKGNGAIPHSPHAGNWGQDAPDNEISEELGDGEETESGELVDGEETESIESSDSDEVHFDLSHLVSASPTKSPQGKQASSSSLNGEELFSPEQNPNFSPLAGNQEIPPTYEDYDEDDAESSESSGFHMDLSYLVQPSTEIQKSDTSDVSPLSRKIAFEPSEILPKNCSVFGNNPTASSSDSNQRSLPNNPFASDSDDDLPEDTRPLPTSSHADIKAKRPPSTKAVSDLVDTSEDESFASHNEIAKVSSSLPKSSTKVRSTSKYSPLPKHTLDLLDTSEEESESEKQVSKSHSRDLVESSSENEWSDESSSDASFDSPYPSSDDDFERQGKRGAFPQGRTLYDVDASDSEESFGEENVHPNKKALANKKVKRSQKNNFKKNREGLAQQYFHAFNSSAFDGKLDSIAVKWSNKLRSTAGLTRLKTISKPGCEPLRQATVELSTKVLDDQERLQSTLLHEMVHAAAWIVDGVSRPPHGACFKKWASRAMQRVPGVEVTTTHDYQIQYKYAWSCTTPGCKFLVRRHSRSVDLQRHCCGRCRGRLVEVDASTLQSTSGPTPKKRAPPSGYNLFVKEHSKAIRERLINVQKAKGIRNPTIAQAEVLKECARRWKSKKSDVP